MLQYASGRPPDNGQSDFFSYNFGEEFVNEEPSTILEYVWYYTVNATLMIGTILFFLLMLFIALFQLFPNLFYAAGGVLVFLMVFSPDSLRCCGRNEKKIKMKSNTDRNDDENGVNKNKKIELPIIEQKDIERKGFICIIAMNDRASSQCLLLQPRYRKDPFSFYKINKSDDNEKFIDANTSEIPFSDDNDIIEEYDVVAVCKGGERWTGLVLPQYKVQSSIHSRKKDSVIDMSRSSQMAPIRELIDIWLLKLIGGEINWTLAIDQEIPDGIIQAVEE